MRFRYGLFVLIAALGLALVACQTDQNAVPTEAPAIPTATDASAQPPDTAEPAEGEEDYPGPAEQESAPTSESDSYPAPTEDTSETDTEAYP